MDKVISKAYSERGRSEHERIFGKKKPDYEDKMLHPDTDKKGFETK